MKPGLLNFVTVITISVLILTISGCSDINNLFSDLSGDSEYVTGTITQMTGPITGTEGIRILVEENTEVNEPLEAGGKKVWFSVSDETDIFRMGRRGPVQTDDLSILEKGQTVRAWDTGIHMTSYPSQTGARKIIILSD